MPTDPRDAPPWGLRLTYGGPSFSLAAAGMVFNTWLTYFYLPPGDEARTLVAAPVFAAALLISRLVDAIAEPLIGIGSDRTRTRLGRRRPFILAGTPVLAASFIALWLPPFPAGSAANGIWLAGVLGIYWFSVTTVLTPWFALLPELAPTPRGRVALSTVVAGFNVIGLTAGGLLPGLVADHLGDAPVVLGVEFLSGIQPVALVAGALLLLYLIPGLFLREEPPPRPAPPRQGMYRALLSTLRNRAFRTYLAAICMVELGLNVVVVMIPYFATQILEGAPGETRIVAAGHGRTWAGAIVALVVLGAAATFPLVSHLTARWGKRRVYLRAGVLHVACLASLPLAHLAPDPALVALPLFTLMALPLATHLVLPNAMYGDVVDRDAAHTGDRREGTYAAARNLLVKLAYGLAQALAVGLIALGATRADPAGILLVGPLAAACVLVGLLAFRRHPIQD
jgi:glycoside/pentoside/hexuronide:cation symporter, GPH family